MTVSRVLSDPELVLPATRDRVQRAIADLGYVPDEAAGSLSNRRTGFIALILPTLTNANFAAVARGLTDVLREADYHLLIAYIDRLFELSGGANGGALPHRALLQSDRRRCRDERGRGRGPSRRGVHTRLRRRACTRRLPDRAGTGRR